MATRLSRVLDGRRESMVAHTADEAKAAQIRGWFVDEDQDGVPDAPASGGEFPKVLHGTVQGKPVEKTVQNADEEAAARAKGWGDTPKQDHGPTSDQLDQAPPEPALDGAPKGRKR